MADLINTPDLATNIITELFKLVLKGLQQAETWFREEAKGHDPFGIAGRKYFTHVNERYNSMRILGMSHPVPLRDIYVRVNILNKVSARQRVSVDELERFFDRDRRTFGEKRETREGQELADRLQKVIVLGKPGSGKTTFLKALALQALDNKLQEKRIPIFVGLKDWNDSTKTILDFIVEQFDICGFPEAKPFVERMLERGKCLLLLDGFDEVTRDLDHAITQIRNFSDKYKENHFILSCRIASYNYVFEKFTEVEMADFNDKQIFTFITNWFQHDKKSAEQCWEKMTFPENRAIKELASTPLLLTLLCLAFDEQLTFPRNRSELYKEATDALLKKWDNSRRIQRQEVYKKLSLQRKENLLSRIAHSTFLEGKYFIRQHHLEQAIADYIKHLPDAAATSIEPDSESILKAIEAHHGLLVERASGIYSFSHLTVQEYFTARYLLEDRTKDNLSDLVAQHLTDDRWREIFLLLTGMLNDSTNILLAMRAEVSTFAKNETLAALLTDVECVLNPNNPFPRYGSRPLTLFYLLSAFVHLATSRSDKAIFAIDVEAVLHGLSGFLSGGTRAGVVARYDPYDPNLDSVLNVARAVALAVIRDRAFDRFVVRDLSLAKALSLGLDSEVDLNNALARIVDPARTRSVILSRYPFICSPDAEKAINSYLRGSQVLVDCLTADCYVANDTRQKLLDGLFKEP